MTHLRDRIVVTVAAVIWVAGFLFGSGPLGDGGVDDQGDGLFTDSTTLIAPMGPAFSIWSVIYVGLAAYVVWQWISSSRWAERTRLPAAASIALNGIWLLVVFADWVTGSVLVILGIAVSLGLVLHNTADLRRQGWAAELFVSVTFGLYLGWVCVATCANIASWLVGLGFEPELRTAEIITIVVLLVVVGLAAWLLSRTPHLVFQTAFAAAVVWGLSWVAVGRLTDEPESTVVGYAAAVSAVLVVALWVWSLVRGRGMGAPAEHDAVTA